VPVLQKTSTKNAQADWIDDEYRRPENMEPIFWLPDTPFALADVKRQSVIDQIPVQLSHKKPKSLSEGDYFRVSAVLRTLQNIYSQAAFLFGLKA
jgi:hypothetical protein